MKLTRKTIAAIGAVAVMAGTAACGDGTTASNDAGLGTADNPVEIEVWAFGNGQQEIIDAFEKANPTIKVKYNNVGTAGDGHLKLGNAFEAKSGEPDVALIEDPVISQFAIKGALTDLSEFGADKLADEFASGPWNKVQFNGKPYGIPSDAAPEMFFYNKEIFDKAGIAEPPKTWDEYYEDAKLIRKLGPDYYIANNAGVDFNPFVAQIWEAGAQPWKIDGEKISINFTGDAGVQKYIEFQQKLIDEDLINTKISNWNDDWYRSLGDGTTASLSIGSWMASNLESNAPNASGKWRVAQLPQWSEGGNAGAEDGGSALTILQSSKKKQAAWKFIQFHTHEGAEILASFGKAPALKAVLESDSFLNKKSDYFGGQSINEEFDKATKKQFSSFQFPPFTASVNTMYADAVGKAYQNKSIRLKDAFAEYEQQQIEYAKNQGFDVA